MLQPVARAEIYWLTPGEGGRLQPPSGPVYAATARLVEDAADQDFSLVLRTTEGSPGDGARMRKVNLTLLWPDNLPEVKARLQPGSKLLISEGARTVARGEVLSVSMEDAPQGLLAEVNSRQGLPS
jgi:hypothetical protein